jgi:hypothetical protein
LRPLLLLQLPVRVVLLVLVLLLALVLVLVFAVEVVAVVVLPLLCKAAAPPRRGRGVFSLALDADQASARAWFKCPVASRRGHVWQHICYSNG